MTYIAILIVLLSYCADCIEALKSRQFNVDLTRTLSTRSNGKLIHTPAQAQQLIMEAQYPVDDRSFAAALGICNEHDDVTTLLYLFELYKIQKVKPNRLCYSLAIAGCMRGNEFEKAIQLFEECDNHFTLGSSQKDYTLDRGLYATIIGTMGKASRYDDVIKYYSAKRQRGMNPSESTVNTVLIATLQNQLWDKFDSIVHEQLHFPTLNANKTSTTTIPITFHSTPFSQQEELVNNNTDSTWINDIPLKKIPNEAIYLTLIRAAGSRKDSHLAMRYLQSALRHSSTPPTRAIFRETIEACHVAGNEALATATKVLLEKTYGTIKSEIESNNNRVPKAILKLQNGTYFDFTNDLTCMHSTRTRRLYSELKRKSEFDFNVKALPEKGRDIPIHAAQEILLHHAEKKSLAFYLNHIKDLHLCKISVNIRMCQDCHSFFKAVSKALRISVTCTDPGWLHTFQNGVCSCNDLWTGR